MLLRYIFVYEANDHSSSLWTKYLLFIGNFKSKVVGMCCARFVMNFPVILRQFFRHHFEISDCFLRNGLHNILNLRTEIVGVKWNSCWIVLHFFSIVLISLVRYREWNLRALYLPLQIWNLNWWEWILLDSCILLKLPTVSGHLFEIKKK